MNNIEVIFLGSEFYRDSGTRLGNLYTTSGKRMDMAKIEALALQGNTITIRPATLAEKQPYTDRLVEILNECHKVGRR